jgi:hypothetical protein
VVFGSHSKLRHLQNVGRFLARFTLTGPSVCALRVVKCLVFFAWGRVRFRVSLGNLSHGEKRSLLKFSSASIRIGFLFLRGNDEGTASWCVRASIGEEVVARMPRGAIVHESKQTNKVRPSKMLASKSCPGNHLKALFHWHLWRSPGRDYLC